jgi:hypothetical protein
VSEQYDVSAHLVGHVAQGVVPRGPGRTLWPAVVTDLYCANMHGIESQRLALLGRPRSNVSGLDLEPVVHDDRSCGQSQLRRFEGSRCRQSQ